MSSLETDGITVDNLTLRQRVEKDKHTAKTDSSIKFGHKYWSSIRELYQSAESPQKLLAVQNDKEDLPADLLSAMVSAKKNNRIPLINWLEAFDIKKKTINQRCVVGLFKWGCSLKPAASADQMSAFVALLKFVYKANLNDQFSDECAYCRRTWDDGLLALYTSAKKGNVTTEAFVQLHANILTLVIDKDSLTQLREEAQSWGNCKDALHTVVSGSTVGRAIFSFALVHLIEKSVADEVEKHVQTMHGGPQITVDIFNTHKKTTLDDVEQLENVSLLLARRTIKMTYRGLEYACTVNSLAEDVDMRFWNHVKSMAAASGDLVGFFAEGGLVDKSITCPKEKFHADILAGPMAARAAANEIIRASECQDAEAIKAPCDILYT